MELVYFR